MYLVTGVGVWSGFVIMAQQDSSVFRLMHGSAKQIDLGQAEYPRCQMVRSDWLSLDGQWDFGLARMYQTNIAFSRGIAVPLPPESGLSGFGRAINEQQILWYRRRFSVPPEWRNQRILVHFEAVDWDSKVSVNGKICGEHKGGYDRFTFDMTDFLTPSGEQELVVSVHDPTEAGFEPRGKQMVHPRPPFFNASSGIWQTVWLEPVPATHIESLKLVPDIDAGIVKVALSVTGATNGITAEAVGVDEGREVGRAEGTVGSTVKMDPITGGQAGSPPSAEATLTFRIPNAKLWSPDLPFLYDLKVSLLKDGRTVDEVASYFGMRKISVAKDESGFPRIFLNNNRLFELGALDQGYWPDGRYAAPDEDALRRDVELAKELGFNMVRKHVKVEAERWYYWCDKLGLLVWQDMPNGDRNAMLNQQEIKRSPESAAQFETELTRMIEQHRNHPSIVMWIAFNQGWGQYDTVRITSLIKQLDPSRLVCDATGWYDMGVGDVRSLHPYFGPFKAVNDGKRPCVFGECGALGLVISGHEWKNRDHWTTRYYETPEELFGAYSSLMDRIQDEEEHYGLSAAVITQLTDVESEQSGFVTGDRQVIKMPVEKVREINQRVIHANVRPAVSAPVE